MRLLGVILIIVGFVVFLGDVTELFLTIRGLGIVTVIIGFVLVYLKRRLECDPPGIDEWR